MTKKRWRIIDNLFMQSKKWNKIMNIINDERIKFHKIAIDDYEHWMKRFLEILYIIILIIYDLPRRIKEMTSLKFVNTMNNDRNIYLENE